MSGLSKKFILESIKHYEEIIADYKDIITGNEKILKSGCSDRRKEAAQALIDISKGEIKICQKEIRRLLCEN